MTLFSDTQPEHTFDSPSGLQAETAEMAETAANTSITPTTAVPAASVAFEPARFADAAVARERTPGTAGLPPLKANNGTKTPPSLKSTNATGSKPPKLPRYITRRKPDNLLMYVRRIPADILAAGIYPETQTAIRICLGTRDWLTAQPKANQLTAQLEALWAEKRSAMPAPATLAHRDRRKLHADDIPVLTKRLVANLLHSDDLDRGECMGDAEYDTYETELEEQRKRLRRAAQRADLDHIRDEAVGILATEGLECEETSPEWQGWLKAVLQAHLEALGAISQRLDGQSVPTPKAAPPVRSEDDLDDLGRALEYWQTKTSPQPKTVIEMRSAVARLQSSTGRNRISAITADDVVAFMRAEQNRDSARGGKVNPQTANKALALLKALFSLVNADYLGKLGIGNPLADTRKFKVKAKDRRNRQSFTLDNLKTLFSGPVHVEGARPAGGSGDAAYWIPVLGYTTGARMQELAQALTSDVVERDGVILLRVTTMSDEEGDQEEQGAKQGVDADPEEAKRSVKTEQSKRLLPLHRDVLALGFMDYVQWLRDCGHKQLFPDVRPGAHESWSASVSKFFNRYLRQRGIKRPMLDFVSFRHDFKTQSREIPELKQDVVDYIQGHTPNRASQGYGEFSPRVLHQSINLMQFPALAECRPWKPTRRRAVNRSYTGGPLGA